MAPSSMHSHGSARRWISRCWCCPPRRRTGSRRRTTNPRVPIVVATHGDDDAEALASALATPARYVSLVASRKRAASVMERLRRRAIPVARLDEVRAPAGLDIGAVTPQEIAVSILAEIVQVARGHKPEVTASEPGAEAIDPICGMTVETATARFFSETPDGTVYFCCHGCKEAFDAAQIGTG